MKAVCPSCGAFGSVELFIADADAREFAALLAGMPAELGPLLLQYLSLFRPRQKALAWGRALRLLRELQQPISTGYVRRHGRDWAAPTAAWTAALNDMLSRREKLQLPLNDHAYLFEIIASNQNRTEAAIEQRAEDDRRVHASQRQSSGAQALGAIAAPAAAPLDMSTQLDMSTPKARAIVLLADEIGRRRRNGEPAMTPAQARKFQREAEAGFEAEGKA